MESNSSFEELLRRVGSGAYLLGGDPASITEFSVKDCDFLVNCLRLFSKFLQINPIALIDGCSNPKILVDEHG